MQAKQDKAREILKGELSEMSPQQEITGHTGAQFQAKTAALISWKEQECRIDTTS
jgi:hypothetical protein